MSGIYRLSWRSASVVVLAALSACGTGQPGPTAQPELVVRQAPDRTVAAATADVQSTGPYVNAEGTVTFSTGADKLQVAGRKTTSPPWGVLQPAGALDLLRGVVDVYAYGGAQVQGIGTKRYQIEIDLDRAIDETPAARRADLELLRGKLGKDNRIWGDVFVDAAGRVRRILLPVDTASERPGGDSKRFPQLVSVDYSFGKDGE